MEKFVNDLMTKFSETKKLNDEERKNLEKKIENIYITSVKPVVESPEYIQMVKNTNKQVLKFRRLRFLQILTVMLGLMFMVILFSVKF